MTRSLSCERFYLGTVKLGLEAAKLRAAEVEAEAVAASDFEGDVQAQALAVGVATAGIIAAEAALRDGGKLSFGDARAVVDDAEAPVIWSRGPLG